MLNGSPALSIAFGNITQVHAENSALKTVHACVPAYFVVVVALTHAVLTQHPDPLGQLRPVGRDQSRIAGGAQVFGGVKAEGGDISQRSCRCSPRLSTPGLGCVFDQGEVVLFAQTRKCCPIDTLAIEMHRQKRSNWNG